MNAAAMAQGRERARRQRREAAVKRVRAFNNWRRHGFDSAHTPAVIPTDRDFRLAREAQR